LKDPPPVAPSTITFMNELAAAIPEVGAVIRARRREEKDLLPYMEMMALLQWIRSVSVISEAQGEGASSADRTIRDFLLYLETHFEVGDPEVDNLIALGFLEGLGLTEDQFPKLRTRLPTRLSAWLASTYEDEDPREPA
jgi:hypothetical protein